ncbi:two component transcriptional regulator, LuxR family [Paraburkholderia phenazinium]|jgi:two-component system capsular synthesis response regulator RcsB|uniref:Two component transcriptional regulator, LuxR family n=2 Tax=Burkholderiaceae TaxID=119060 RepID=A0A1N6L4C0_9BURK|nr:two component transcriptional regulator, LuxR family [Paraburkholderia phenazinium]
MTEPFLGNALRARNASQYHNNKMTPITRVIVADDHSCVRLGVRRLLEAVPSLSIVGEASDTQTLAELVDTCPCDVVVSDIGMPDIDGLRNATPTLRRVLRHPPHPRVVVLTMICHPPTLSGLLHVGVSAIVDKRDTIGALADAIEAAVAGHRYLSASVQLAFDEMGSFPQPRAGVLSAREWEVFRLYIEGMSISEIAMRLDRSGKTISTQKRSAMRKLGLDSESALIKYAQQLGLT